MSEPLIAQVSGLSALVELQRRALHTQDLPSLRFLMVNDSHSLVPYRQAALAEGRRMAALSITALSGIAAADSDAPYVAWLTALLRRLPAAEGAMLLDAERARQLGFRGVADWSEWLPPHALWLPLRLPGDGRRAGLLLTREQPFSERERVLLEYLADAYGHALTALLRPPSPALRLWRAVPRKSLLVLLLLAGLGAVPVPLTTLAPGEVVPVEPSVVRAPLDAVVESILVKPNEAVVEGQPLLLLDGSRLRSQLAVSQGGLAVAEAEYRQALTQAVRDPDAKSRLAVLQSRIEQQRVEVGYLSEMLGRLEVKAPRAGVAIFDDAGDWIGRPVTVGVRIMVVADPARVELEMHLPVNDAIVLQEGAPVSLFLNTAPEDPIPANLSFASYRSSLSPEGVLSYRLRAQFAPEVVPPRIGLKGTARVKGDDVALAYLLFRRPLTVLRQWLGS